MLAAGVPSRAIMEVLGHSGISVTMNTYAHVLPALRQEAADAIDEVFGRHERRFGSSDAAARSQWPVDLGAL
jgi:hypothetical protein